MKRATRVLLLVTQADWGGVQNFLIQLATELIKEGRTVLLAGGGEGELWTEARKRGIPARQLRFMKREISPVNDVRAVSELRDLIDEFKPDAIHLNSAKMGVIGSIAAHQSSAKPFVVYRIGGWTFLEPLPAWKKWIYKKAEYVTAAYKDIIVTLHPDDERAAVENGFRPRRHIAVIPNGIDLVSFVAALQTRAAARTRLGLPEHAFVYGTIANAYATKGLLPYLDVLKRRLDEDRSAVAIILGDGPEFEQLKQKRKDLGLTDRVLLPGHTDAASTYLPAFDVFVLPSRKEGMPWAILEAMSAGLPCIATDVGACRWILEKGKRTCGIVVPKDDATMLLGALRDMKNDSDRRSRFSEAGRLEIAERFTWSTTLKGHRDALDRTL